MSNTGVNVITFFTSGSGSPATGLMPTIVIRDVVTTFVVKTGTLTEVGDGCYKFPFPEYDGDSDYSMVIDGGIGSLDTRFTFAGNESFVQDVWGTQRTLHTISGSAGEAQRDVYDIEVGSWRILSNGTMELLRSGTNDVIATFNLQDINGINLTDPLTQDPFKRSRL